MPTFETKVGPDRNVKLPTELCERLSIQDGTRVEFFLTVDGQVHFHAITQGADRLGGFAIDRRNPPLSIREMDDAIGDYLGRKVERLNRQASEDGDRVRPAAE